MKRSLHLLICLILFSTISISAQSETEKGVELYRNRKYDEAIETLKKASTENYRDVTAFYFLGLAQENQNKNNEAMQSYKKAFAVCLDLIERNLILKAIEENSTGKKQNLQTFVSENLEKDIESALLSIEKIVKLDSAITSLKNWQNQTLILKFFEKKRQPDKIDLENSIYKPLNILATPQPIFPQKAGINRTFGVINLYILFLSNGEIGVIVPKNYLPDGLTESAVKAAKDIKFEPALVNNKPISLIKSVQYTFSP